MASWMVAPDPNEKEIETTPLVKAQAFFAVDDSRSTSGQTIKREREFVENWIKNSTSKVNSISLWGNECDDPVRECSSLQWKSSHGNTHPKKILEKKSALRAIKKSDVWILSTDGEIFDSAIHELAELVDTNNIAHIPIIFLIVGSRGRTPATTNISVGISFFVGSEDALVLFKEIETGRIYLICGKGCFAPLENSGVSRDLILWGKLPVFNNDDHFFQRCSELDIKVTKAPSRSGKSKHIHLGQEWESVQGRPVRVDMDLLSQAGLLSNEDACNLFAEESFHILAMAFKTRKRLPEFKSFVLAQKIEQCGPKFEDISGATGIISALNQNRASEQEQMILQAQLREAHVRNREHYQRSVIEFSDSPVAHLLHNRNQRVDSALRVIQELETSGFNASILSGRASRAGRTNPVTKTEITPVTSLDLEGIAFRAPCFICCGDNEVMSICLKELDAENTRRNTSDFALKFPLAEGARNVNVVSSQNVCFQCALLGNGLSIYKETLTAVIPVVSYNDHNRRYIDSQLYSALTSGSAMTEIAQLFLSIIHEVLTTRSWAGAGTRISQGDQQETVQRQQTLQWMMKEMLEKTQIRERFTKGDNVPFKDALRWIAQDFATNHFSSLALTYPPAGFPKLIHLGQQAAAFSDLTVRQMRTTRYLYAVAKTFLADRRAATRSLTTNPSVSVWKQKYLELIYKDFNTALVPKDLEGSQSLVTDPSHVLDRLQTHLPTHQADIRSWATTEDQENIMQKSQLILFWLIFRQTEEDTVPALFYNMERCEHLGRAVLDPALRIPECELQSQLLSIFTKKDGRDIDSEISRTHLGVIPFRTPFGGSVLHCGFEACNTPFYDMHGPHGEINDIETVRIARARHLAKVFSTQDSSERSNGLPQPMTIGDAPLSTHINLHIGVARTWAKLLPAKRRAILDEDEEREEFVSSARKRICDQRRGNIFSKDIDQKVRDALPSFFDVLGQAMQIQGNDGDITMYEHDFKQNTVEAKMQFELRAMELLRHSEPGDSELGMEMSD